MSGAATGLGILGIFGAMLPIILAFVPCYCTCLVCCWSYLRDYLPGKKESFNGTNSFPKEMKQIIMILLLFSVVVLLFSSSGVRRGK